MAKVGETLTATPTPSGATVSYQWLRSDTKDGTYIAITGATEQTYKLNKDDANKWITVEIKGTGRYTGNKTSEAVGPVEVDTEAYYVIVASIPDNNKEGIYTAVSWDKFVAAIYDCNLGLTAADGQDALDAEVIKIQAALDLLVEVEEITTATVMITVPVLGEEPVDAEAVHEATNDPRFTVTKVEWNEELTSQGRFKAEQSYSVTIELTAKAGNKFALDCLVEVDDATVNDINVADTGEGNIVTFVATFDKTGDLEVTGVTVKKQPRRKYFENLTAYNKLVLTDLVLVLDYNEGTKEDVSYSKDGFLARGITASPSHGTELTVKDHDGTPVVINCNGYEASTGDLDVTVGVASLSIQGENGATTIKRGGTLQMCAVPHFLDS